MLDDWTSLLSLAKWVGMGCGTMAAPAEPRAAARPPNILVILVDDLGYGDLSINGSTDIKTPNIDALARRSVRCVNGYTLGPSCDAPAS